DAPKEMKEATIDLHGRLIGIARFPRLRVLAWAGDQLYASRGYQLLRASVQDPSSALTWQPVADFHAEWRRQLSVMNGLTARLFRDSFHALAVLPSGGLVAAVPGAIVTLRRGETEFGRTHSILRGTRPLHITAVPDGTIYWGEYFDNSARDEVHVYASTDAGATWSVAYTFPKGAIRHIHNIVHDPWGNYFCVLTGDYGDECSVQGVLYPPKNRVDSSPILEVEDMALGSATKDFIRDEIKEQLGAAIDKFNPHGWRRFLYLAREWGILGTIATVIVGLLAISAAAIYQATARIGKEAIFETNTTRDLTDI